MLKISIALATYNGSQYLPEQLASYTAQTRLPDQLVVCDDNSSDGTLEIVADFAKTAPFEVRYERNEQQLGIIGNFSKAMQLCDGDIIVFSDQDDVWFPNKLARIEETFETLPQSAVLMSDADIVDENRHSLGYTFWESVRFTPRLQQLVENGRALEVLCRGNYTFGITLAFRAEYRKYLLPIPPTGFHHDLWTARYLSAIAPFALIHEPLLQYRQHAKQKVGAKRTSITNRLDVLAVQQPGASIHRRYEKRSLRFSQVRDRVAETFPHRRDSITFLDQHVQFLDWRGDLPSRRITRIIPCLKNLIAGKYHRHAEGFISFGKDLLQKDRK